MYQSFGAHQDRVKDISHLFYYNLGSAVPNCLDFWIRERDHFRQLYNLALDILAIPATSAPLEGYFSQASAVLDGRRYRLSAQMLEAELFLRVNANM